MRGLETLPLRTQTGEFHAVIETPRGSRVKYSYDKDTGLFLAKKMLALGYSFPFPFGFLPSTKGEDGDPVDVLVLTAADLPTGALVKLELIGLIRIEQQEAGRSIRNDRILGAPLLEGGDSQLDRLSDLGEATLREIEAFLVGYQKAEAKTVRILGRGNGAEAARAVDAWSRGRAAA
jgi:inorganic pyrophosphatase